MERKVKPEITLEEQTVTGIFGSFFGIFLAIIMINLVKGYIPGPFSIFLTPASYILVSFIPFFLMYRAGQPLEYYGFSDKDIPQQINTGILSGLILSCIIIVPHFLIGQQKGTQTPEYLYVWQYAADFVISIFAVAFCEEVIFRGFLYSNILTISGNVITAVIISSVVFGLFHIFQGSPEKILRTALIGIIFCAMRLKIKNCTTLSLIVCHGIFNAMDPIISYLFSL